MPPRRDPSLIPLSHDHHHGLVRVFEIRRALRGGEDLAAQLRRTLAFYRDDLTPHFRAEEDALVPGQEQWRKVAGRALGFLDLVEGIPGADTDARSWHDQAMQHLGG